MATDADRIAFILQPLASGIENAIEASGIPKQAFVLVVFTEDAPGMYRPQFVANADTAQVIKGLEEMVRAYKENDVTMIDLSRKESN